MTFTAATYNVLASAYLRREWYPNSPPHVLDNESRKRALASYITRLDADLICLQEVEEDAFGLIDRALTPRGFTGTYSSKGRGKPDGCAVFLRADRFTVEESVRLEYDEQLRDSPSGHIAQLLVLGTQGRRLAVGNTHLKWDPPDTPVALRYGYAQMRQLLAAITELLPGDPGIVCGDFNVTPGNEVIELLRQNRFAYSHAGQTNAATCNANQRAKLIDYLFFNAGLRAEPLPLVPVADTTPLPGPDQPSDHVPVLARCRFA